MFVSLGYFMAHSFHFVMLRRLFVKNVLCRVHLEAVQLALELTDVVWTFMVHC